MSRSSQIRNSEFRIQNSEYLPYGRQSISEKDIRAVVAVMRSDWLTQGPAIEEFENKVADYCGARYAVAVSNATAALHLGCLALGLQNDDLLWTSPNTFVASANCALYCGADVDFVDIDPHTCNLSVEKLEEKLVAAQKKNRLPKIVVPVHFAGRSCEMEKIFRLSRKYGFRVLEDASHAVGGRYRHQPIGSCDFSDLCVFSFHPVKIITTGEGGMILTNKKGLFEKLIRLRSHGITRQKNLMAKSSAGPWYYEQIELGFNYRLTDFQAALGISQMERLDKFVSRRQRLARRYDKLLNNLPLRLPQQKSHSASSWHLYVIRLQLDKISKTRREIFEVLRAENIGVNVHYIPVHTQPFYRKLGFKDGDFPAAEKHYSEAISLPLFADLSNREQDRVVTALRKILQ
ncbi:MAG: UDP-4-amino-4,6-dideoxy-N-acetyl-beta-L-altrosamine transaminase [Verrucomicrobiota bacterium]